MALITLNAALDMSLADPLGLGNYAFFSSDVISFARFSDDANNYTEITGGGLFVVTDGIKVVDGATVFTYSGGSVSGLTVVNLYNAGQYDAIMPLFLAGDDRISGSTDADVLKGFAGKDIIHGRSGRDILDGGDDSDRLFGDNGNDILTGRAGNDVLRGGFGRDSLTGGGGRDRFVFDTALGGSNVDTIEDFTHGKDTIALDQAVFGGLAAGHLPFEGFTTSTPTTAAQKIVYDSSTGEFSYDADGSGAAAAIVFARVNPGTPVTFDDFVVI